VPLSVPVFTKPPQTLSFIGAAFWRKVTLSVNAPCSNWDRLPLRNFAVEKFFALIELNPIQIFRTRAASKISYESLNYAFRVCHASRGLDPPVILGYVVGNHLVYGNHRFAFYAIANATEMPSISCKP
jgi:hypothetical protein